MREYKTHRQLLINIQPATHPETQQESKNAAGVARQHRTDTTTLELNTSEVPMSVCRDVRLFFFGRTVVGACGCDVGPDIRQQTRPAPEGRQGADNGIFNRIQPCWENKQTLPKKHPATTHDTTQTHLV